MSARKIRNSWWVDFRHDGVRYRKRSPENSQAGAKAYELRLRHSLASPGGTELVGTSRNLPRTNFATFVTEWFETYVRTNNKPSEQTTKANVLRVHLVPFFGAYNLAAIGPFEIERYKASRRAGGLSEKSVNNHLTILRRCLACAVEWKLLAAVPRIQWLRPPPPDIDFLSGSEAMRLVRESAGTAWHTMIVLALHTGLRLGELRALDWSDLELDARLLTVRRSVARDVVTSPKSNRIRHVPLTEEACRSLAPYRRTSGFVFSRPDGRPVSAQRAWKALAQLCRRMSLRRIGWHTLRHTFASLLVMRGVPLRAVQELLGHSTILMTMRYAHLAPSVLRDSVAVLEHLDDAESVGNRWATQGQTSPGNAGSTVITHSPNVARIIEKLRPVDGAFLQ